jgi:hypothetical protein
MKCTFHSKSCDPKILCYSLGLLTYASSWKWPDLFLPFIIVLLSVAHGVRFNPRETDLKCIGVNETTVCHVQNYNNHCK